MPDTRYQDNALADLQAKADAARAAGDVEAYNAIVDEMAYIQSTRPPPAQSHEPLYGTPAEQMGRMEAGTAAPSELPLSIQEAQALREQQAAAARAQDPQGMGAIIQDRYQPDQMQVQVQPSPPPPPPPPSQQTTGMTEQEFLEAERRRQDYEAQMRAMQDPYGTQS